MVGKSLVPGPCSTSMQKLAGFRVESLGIRV